jgi:hypothetical protein
MDTSYVTVSMLHPARKEYSPILCQSRATGSAWSPDAGKPGAFRAYGLTVGNHGDFLLGEVQISPTPEDRAFRSRMTTRLRLMDVKSRPTSRS